MTCNVAADMLKRNVLGGLFWRAARRMTMPETRPLLESSRDPPINQLISVCPLLGWAVSVGGKPSEWRGIN